MKSTNPVIKQVPIKNSDLTLRYDANAIRAEAFEILYPLVHSAVQDPARSSEIASQLAERALNAYEERTAMQLRAVQEAMKTEAFDHVFSEWIPTLKLSVTPKSYKAIRGALKKSRRGIINSRYQYVWDVPSHRPARTPLEEAVKGEEDQRRLIEIMRQLHGDGLRDITQTDVARVMFKDVNGLPDKRSKLSNFLRRPGVDFRRALALVEEEHKQMHVKGQLPQLTLKG